MFLLGDWFILFCKLYGEIIVLLFLLLVGWNKRCWRKKDLLFGKKDGWFVILVRRWLGLSWWIGNEFFKWNLLFNLMIVLL